MQGEARISELVLLDRLSSARFLCPPGLIPAPGQYVVAHADGTDAPLASVLFPTGTSQDGFVAAPPIPSTWGPGTRLYVRGPLGHGFSLPPSARKIALAALDCSPRTLLSLLKPALRQEASVTLVGESIPDDLPLQVEAQPAGSLLDICRWADFVAFDVSRASLPQLRLLFQADRTSLKAEAQVLVRTPLPCAALAACGVCTVEVGGEALLACEEGPVFDLHQVMGWSSRA